MYMYPYIPIGSNCVFFGGSPPLSQRVGVLLGSEDLEKRQRDDLVMDHWGVVFGLGPFR